MIIKRSQKQSERLRFIDFRLMFCGFLNRADLMEEFDVAPAAATRDLAAYKDAKPGNLIYDKGKRSYLASEGFEPLFHHSSQDALSYFAQRKPLLDEKEPLVPCNFPVELNVISEKIVAKITQAISQARVLKISYLSLSSGKKTREVVPHCIVNNGIRWHVRAFDRSREMFLDLVLSRILKADLTDSLPTAPQERHTEDRQWNRFVDLELVAHPRLDHGESIEHEYQMSNGLRRIEMRAALAGYFLRRMNVDCSADHSLEGPEYHLWLRNSIALYGIANIEIAPGYDPDLIIAK